VPLPARPALAHRRLQLTGRDPHEEHRGATPLELLYDLTFVVAFGIAANELARYVADGDPWTGVFGFAFASFAVAWAWINYSWFASAYDTDDWVMRIATMVQMVGVIVLRSASSRRSRPSPRATSSTTASWWPATS
jgi:low temperature requirement protein LtrA